MKGRRTAALLCVLLAHALIIFLMWDLQPPPERQELEASRLTEPIHIYLDAPPGVQAPTERAISVRPLPLRPRPPVSPAVPVAPGEAPPAPGAITAPENVDWPLEAKKSVARVLAGEAEAERVARMFSGPNGTWASLTPRERSKLKKFKWKRGVEAPKIDTNGNTIVEINDRCVLINFSFVGCSIGKVPAYGELFKDMRLYFDEERLPETDVGNGR